MLSWSFHSAAACGLSLLALLGSTGAQLNNDTSPTSQFKSVCTYFTMYGNVDERGDVELDEGEPGLAEEVLDVRHGTGDQVP